MCGNYMFNAANLLSTMCLRARTAIMMRVSQPAPESGSRNWGFEPSMV